MIAGFIIWSLMCALLFGVGIWTWNAKKPAGFFAGVKPPEVTDVRKYNHSVATLWFLYAGLFEAVGLPFLFLKQNSAAFLPVVLGTVILTIAFMIGYTHIENKFRK